MEITLSVNKTNIMTEVARNADYGGAKMTDDENSYGRMTLTDEDGELLERFWDECRADIAQAFVGKIVSERICGQVYMLVLDVSSSFDKALLSSMQLNLFSYFVQGITAKWYAFANKKEQGEYAERAVALLDDVREKSYYKKKPTRPTYN